MRKKKETSSEQRDSKFCRGMCIFAFMIFPGSLFCQAPLLRSATSFAVFTEVGAFNNIGTTNITGDAGTNVGEFNGFPPGIVDGQIDVADAISEQAAIDVDLAYNDLLGTTCDEEIGTTLGSGQVLTPSVYCLAAASTFDGDLTFDGLGNEDAIFIIKINGAFTTGIASKIILINSASACNIYWQVNGQVTLGENSIFKGTLISDGAIIVLNSSTIDGRLLSKAGAISLANDVVTLSCFEIVLPVELYSFLVDCINHEAILCWNTASEINNQNFTVECSTDEINWEAIGIVNRAGNISTISHYTFVHEHPYSLTSYYRLKQTDYDQNFNYSTMITLESCQQDLPELNVFPNPVRNTLFLNYTGDSDKTISIIVFNSIGQSVYYSDTYQSELDLSDFSDGIYFLHFNHTSGMIIKRIVFAR
jgi:hypothetical protein